MKRSSIAGFLSVVGMAFLLYAPFLAIQYDPNGIFEAQNVEAGALLPHNHILYRPIGWAVYRTVEFVGYSGQSLVVLQLLDAIFGTIAVGLFYLAMERLSQHRIAAVGASLWLATSFLYWYVSTDVNYITLAAVFCSASLALVVRGSGYRSAVASGACVALAILTWQASIFLIPGLLLLLFLRSERRSAVLLVGVAGAVAGFGYVALGIFAYDVRSVHGFFDWIFSYGSGASLSMWGHWGFDRVPEALHSAIHSLVPTRLMATPAEILAGRRHLWGGIAVDIGVAATVLLLLMSVFWLVLRIRGKRQYAVFCFLAAYLFFIPFIVWWDPGQAQWYVIPNIMLAGFIALAWDSPLQSRSLQLVFLGCIVAIGGANFFTTFRPRHAELGPDRRVAQCVSANTSSADMVIAAEWGWPEYLGYLHGRNEFNLINNSIPFGADKAAFLSHVRQLVKDTQRAGGKVITADPSQYPPEHLQWLESQTGLTLKDLESLESTAAFVCDDRPMKVLADLR